MSGVHPIQAPLYPAFYRAGNFVFLSGQNAEVNGKIQGDMKTQTQTVFALLQTTLSQAGCTFSDVVKVNGFLANDDNFADFNEVYRTFFHPTSGSYPARSMALGVLHQSEGALIEVEMIAYKQ